MYEIFSYQKGDPASEQLLYRPNNPQALVLSPKLTREVSKGGSLTFTMLRDHAQYDKLQKLSTVVVVKRDGKEIWRGRVLKHEADFYNRRIVYCEGALSYFNDSSVTPFNYKGTLSQFLQHLIEAHNEQVQAKMKCFQLGTVTAALGDREIQFGDADKYGQGEDYGKIWDILDKLVLKTFGGYFYCTFDADTGYNVLNYCDQAVEARRQTVQTIEYGKNLLNLTETTDATDLYTRIYPMGNKHTVKKTAWYYKLMWWLDHSQDVDEDHEERWGIMGTDEATVAKYLPAAGYSHNLKEGWIQNDAAVEKFGIITRTVSLDTDSANDTFAAGVQALQQNYAMKTSYIIRAVDLVDAGFDIDRLDFAMYSHILSKPHSVDAIMLCTKLVEPLDKPAQKEFTFGMTRRTLTDRQVANLGRTNLLEEDADASKKYHQNMLEKFYAYKRQTDSKLGDISSGLTDAVKKMGDLQNQIDDNITSWFYAGVPTTSNAPASSWTTDTVRKQHIGDLYYDKDTGLAYRWVLDGDAYSWVVIRDVGVAKALADAAGAQAAADSKVRCFIATPTPPYDVGDIWMQGTDGDIMRCQTAKEDGQAYDAADWVKASKYTDDSTANAVAKKFNTFYTTEFATAQDEIRARVKATTYEADKSATEETIASLGKKISEAESSITQNATEINLRVKKDDFTGKSIISQINQTAESVAIDARHINLNGDITLKADGKITIGDDVITVDKLKSGQIFKLLWENDSEEEFAAQDVQLAGCAGYSELLFVFYGYSKRIEIVSDTSAVQITSYYTSKTSLIVPLNNISSSPYENFYSVFMDFPVAAYQNISYKNSEKPSSTNFVLQPTIASAGYRVMSFYWANERLCISFENAKISTSKLFDTVYTSNLCIVPYQIYGIK